MDDLSDTWEVIDANFDKNIVVAFPGESLEPLTETDIIIDDRIL